MKEEEFIIKWSEVTRYCLEKFNKKPDLNALLYLIGQRETIQSKIKYKKQEKMDMFHVAICKLMSFDGYYKLDGYDIDGWPHYIQVKELPFVDLFSQERLIKEKIIQYFEIEEIITNNIFI